MAEAPQNLKDRLCAEGLANARTVWTPLKGGRSNRSWKLQSETETLVCKLYPKESTNPLFPNRAGAELAALTELSGKGISPNPLKLLSTREGLCLIYVYVDGEIWKPARESTSKLGKAMQFLHHQNAPSLLKAGPPVASKLLLQGQKILSLCDEAQKQLLPPPPDLPYISETPPVFLHGDLVPANILVTQTGIQFIDWQCPAIGDPCEDFAIFLSPAMQILYGEGPLRDADAHSLLQAYRDPSLQKRFQLLSPLFHWRMAAYCLWKISQGDRDYEQAFQAELTALQA
ncbi:aminoglycoside phosphotransferase family protein [Halocynthiibacter sp. C4]|uniref:aminoglycoside phosphotransferase family protein n=1 Tax=Halocynthiibacter sp. C4 TaxID=2992758 RepID=UPI00237B31C6|nr:aminoglycoside phosphotransferase family protein [Halocynthiibacter sp. C4]MDE0591368.1 aminoglycoside phosphotransferase family protein [Halocynthiibacter sp. C4]